MRILLAAGLIFAGSAAGAGQKRSFRKFLSGLHREALRQGVSPGTLARALPRIRYLPEIVAEDRNQAEFKLSFLEYAENYVSAQRVRDGRKKLRRHGELLGEIENRYGVQAEYIVALWGMETDFGKATGEYPVLSALATLAYDRRRSALFRKELIAAFKMVDRGSVDISNFKGSWAGAAGQFQFLPTRFLRYAVDYDKNGERDIWNGVPDSFASAASFLNRNGWNHRDGLVVPVRLPKGFGKKLVGLRVRKKLRHWSARGVGIPKRYRHRRESITSILQPAGPRGPSYLVFRNNFAVLIKWNAATHYVLSVGLLANRI